jgi:hypothetical protein
VISDSTDVAVRTIKQPVKAGVHRVVWDFRTSPVSPISLEGEGEYVPWHSPDLGYMVTPGEYDVAMVRVQGGSMTPVGPPQRVTCQPLNVASLPAEDLEALAAFNTEVAALSRAISAADAHRSALQAKLPYLEQAVVTVGAPQENWLAEISSVTVDLREIDEQFNGDRLLLMDEGQSRMSLKGRTDMIVASLWTTTSAPTGTFERAYREARDAFGDVVTALEQVDARIGRLEDELEAAGAPYTPGRMPVWEGKEP